MLPTAAILEPLKMNPSAVSLLTLHDPGWAHGRDFKLYSPRYQRENGRMDSWLRYLPGSMPKNQKKLKATLPPDEYLAKIAKGFDLAKLQLPDEFFTKTVQSLMYNYISEKKYFQRMPPSP